MSQGNFNACFKFTIGAEGRYSNDRNDSGNWSGGEVGVGRFIGSCWGISAPVLIMWLGPIDGKYVDAEFMRNLPIEVAKAIYLSLYWNSIKGDSLPAGVDITVWDFGVNAGVRRSVKMMQTILGVDVDGYIGPQTLGAAGSAGKVWLIKQLIEAHKAFYRSLGSERYEDGWINRQNSLQSVALSMVSA